MNNHCLQNEILIDLHQGNLSDADLESVAAHIDGCTECQTHLHTIADEADDLAQILRHGAIKDEYAAEPAYQRVESALRQTASAQATSPGKSSSETIPRTIGGCRILGRLGEGGMGQVFRAYHLDLKREVALKLLPQKRTADEAAIERFRREIQAIGRLDHVNVVRALNAGRDGDRQYLVMELVAGVDLSQLSRLHGSLPVGAACELIRQSAIGLQHAHDHGLVHRDVKPSNLMVTSDVEVKILDLGLARFTDARFAAANNLTATNQIMGTIDFMAPEQGDGTRDVDIRSDIYSLGATLYKLLTGFAPFARDEPQPLINRVRDIALGDVIPIRERRPGVSELLEQVIGRMLARDPADRFDIPADVATALSPMADASGLSAIVLSVQERIAEESPDKVALADSELPLFDNIDLNRQRQRRKRRLFGWGLVAVLMTGALLAIRQRPIDTSITDHPPNSAPTLDSGSDVLPADTPGNVPRTTHPVDLLSGHQSGVKDLLYLMDGRRVVSVGIDGRVRMFDVETAEELWSTQSRRAYDQLHCVAVSHDQTTIATGGSTFSVYLFDADTGKASGELAFKDGSAGVLRICFAADDKSIVVVRQGGEIDLFELKASKPGRRFNSAVETVEVPSALTLAPDGRSFVVSLPGRGVVQFDLQTGAIIREYTSTQTGWREFLFKKDGTKLVGTGKTYAVAVWDTATGEHVWSRVTDAGSAHRLCVSPDERYWFVGIDDKTIQVIDTITGLLVHVYHADTFCTQRLDLSPDGKRLVSGAGWHVTDRLRFDVDFRLRVWDTSAFAPAVSQRELPGDTPSRQFD